MKKYTSEQLLSPEYAAVLDEIVLVIALSFIDDASTQWLFSNHSRKCYLKGLPKYMRTLVNLALQSDACVTVMTKDEIITPPKSDSSNNSKLEIELPADSTIRAVAITIPPHGNEIFDSNAAAMRAGMLLLPFRCGIDTACKLLTDFVPHFNAMHDEMFPDHDTKYHNHHLFYLATHPDCRGQGIGKKMLLALEDEVRQLNEVEEEKAKVAGEKFVPAPFYLEASNANNKRLYSRVGFEERSRMTYGKVGDHENVSVNKDGKVLGGRMFGMVWMP